MNRVNLGRCYGADNVLEYIHTDPMVSREFAGLVKEAELMGVDFDDDEMMSGFLQNVVQKLKDTIQKKKDTTSFSVTTEEGTTNIGPGGFSFTSSQQGVAPTPAATGVSSAAELLKNPMVLGGIGLFAAIILLRKKGRR